jgi:outer membrane protein TolC
VRTNHPIAAAVRRTPPPLWRIRPFGVLVAALVLGLATSLASAQASSTVDPGERLEYAELLVLADASPAVAAARLALASAERQAAARGAPLSFTGSAGYAATSGELDPGGFGEAEDLGGDDVAPIAVGVRVDPFVLGPAADELARARQAVTAARDDLAAARRQARIDALSAFQDALAAERAAALAEDDAALARREVDAARERLAAGSASELQVAEAELVLARAEQARGAAARQAEVARRTLTVTLGREVPPPAGPLPEPAPLPDLAALGSDLRGDVRDAERAIADADRSADATVRDALPTLTLDLAYSRGDDASTLLLGGSIDSASLAPSLRLSYDPDSGAPGVLAEDGRLDRFEVSLRLDVAFSPGLGDALAAVRIGQEQARARRDVVASTAEVALEQAWLAALDASERMALATDARELAVRAAKVARLRADAGAVAPIVAARAELDVRRADADLISARDAYRLALFRLLDAAVVPPEDLE